MLKYKASRAGKYLKETILPYWFHHSKFSSMKTTHMFHLITGFLIHEMSGNETDMGRRDDIYILYMRVCVCLCVYIYIYIYILIDK